MGYRLPLSICGWLTGLVLSLTMNPLGAAEDAAVLAIQPPVAKALRANPLRSREDVVQAMRDLYEPLRAYRVPGGFHLGESMAAYSPISALCEAQMRPLWGLVPLTVGGSTFAHWAEWREALIAGTTPGDPGFWGLLTNSEQKAVEMAPLAIGLISAPQELWAPLTDTQKRNLVTWLTSIERCEGLKNNWVFFRILVHVALRHLGQPYDTALHANDLKLMDGCYLGDGWYSDGPSNQRDYYIPMAMHYYALMYSRLVQAEDPERCARYRQNAALFAKDFQHWFTPAGDALPYGRSMTYRFAQASFWSALAYAGVEVDGLSRGQIKGLLLRNLRWWFQQPIFTHGGILSVGYRYPNAFMSEFYNAPGSPYWAAKAFAALGLPANDPFWQVAEEPLPARAPISVQPHAGMVLVHDDARAHTMALASGQNATWMFIAAGNKYEKFAYSSAFGFCALGSDAGIGGGGFDSTLALSDDNSRFRAREACTSVVVKGTTLATRWKQWSDVTVESWVAPVGLGHVRIHHIVNGRALTVCDTGFSLPRTEVEKTATKEGAITLTSGLGISLIRDLVGDGAPGQDEVRPNLNLMHSRVRVPLISRKLPAGEHWLASAVVGIPDAKAEAEAKAIVAGLTWVPGEHPSIVRDGKAVLEAFSIPANARFEPAK